ncbi:aminopeptidase P family protein [Bacteroidetes/Chlorobi group bacterium ChocPot_Mid]|nr:MAG: aminopeptidase P family protein [Bacteroidetes/Chlorobi group bacterium ChocPot_Mid]
MSKLQLWFMHKFMSKKIIIIYFLLNNLLFSQGYKYPFTDGIPVENFIARREQIENTLSRNSALLLLSSDFYANSGFEVSNNPSPNLYYLTGLPQQRAALLLIPNGFNLGGEIIKEALFLKQQTSDDIIWNGYSMGAKDSEKILKIQKNLNIETLDSILNLVLRDKDTLFLDKLSVTKHFSNNGNHIECDIEIISKLKANHPKLIIKDNIPALTQMRYVKDNDEIRLIQKAVDISIEGHKALIKKAKPGMTEYQLQAEMEYQFMVLGAEKPAYSSIVGTGRNSCFLHYQNNRDSIKDGDMILFDCGAKYHGYCADLTRTIPANGKFSIEQKIIYNIVLEAMDSAFAQCKPGNKFSEIHNKAKEVITEKLLEQSIITNKEDVDNYFPHGTSHFFGLNVHEGHEELLKEGNVLTIEPGIYIPYGSSCDERWWNIGIRIEDNVLITKTGYINLSEKLPRKAEEIEEMMK